MKRAICVFGASSAALEEKYYTAAHRVGKALAKAGVGMVYGGGDTGLMGAAARGVYENGGYILGVIPERLHRPGVYFPHCDEMIVTKTMHERKATMEAKSQGFITLPGGIGTLEEVMEVLTLKQLGYHNHPVVLLNLDGFYDPLLAMFARCIEERFTHQVFLHSCRVATTPEQAVELSLQAETEPVPDKLELLTMALEKKETSL